MLLFADSLTFGGVQKAMIELMEGLDRNVWRPALVHHPSRQLAPLLDEASKLHVQHLEVPEMPLGVRGLNQLPGFIKMLRREAPEVFHAHLSWPLACKWALVGAVLSGIPRIVATEHLFLEVPYSRSARLQQRLIAKRAGKYIAVSEGIAGKLEAVFDIPARKIRLIPNGVRASVYENPPCPPELAGLTAHSTKAVILTVARLAEQKGNRYLIEAAAQVPQAIFAIVGEGPEQHALEQQIRSLGLGERVFLFGFRSDIPYWLGCCAVFVLPSLYEGLPIVLLEAMAAGRPVIATAIPGNTEIVIQGVTGLLVPPKDPAALAAAIRSILADPAAAGWMGAAGRKVVLERFSAKNMVRSVEQVYAECLGHKHRSNA